MKQLRRILVPVDFSEVSKAAAHYAIAMGEHFDPTVDILHVWELPLVLGSDALVRTDDPSGDTEVTLAEYARQRVDRAMQDFLAELDEDIKEVMNHRHSLRITHHIETGTPSEVITRIAYDNDYDLVVMGSHGRSGLANLLMGSVVTRVIHGVTCPVVVVPQKKDKR